MLLLLWTALCFYGWAKLYSECTGKWAKILVTLLALVIWSQAGSKMGIGEREEEYDEIHQP